MAAQMIVIEGVIGVGKSILSEKLGQELGYRVMKEPVSDNPYLESFYRDPKRYALEMQFWLMSKRFAMHQDAVQYIWQTGNGVIMDRSIYGDAIFAKQKLYL